MDRAERVELLLDAELTIEEMLAAGIRLQDADDAASILRLRLELDPAEPRITARQLTDAFLRTLRDDDA